MHNMEYRVFRYKRENLKPAVVHLGFGGFGRSFIGDVLDDVAEKGGNLGLVAVAPSDRQAFDFSVLAEQDNIYHLVRLNSKEICQRIGVLLQTMIASHNGNQVVEVMARPDTQIVSLTITANGYFPDQPKDHGTVEKNANDIRALKDGRLSDLQTPLGWIIAALYQRYQKEQEPFVVMSCDNILFNGDMAKSKVMHLAKQTGDEGFISYIEKEVVFPNTVVDRITPKQNFETQAALLRKSRITIPTADGRNVIDRRPIISEHHREFVIEDNGRFPSDLRKAFASAKVEFVTDIAPYQSRKLYLLNGLHLFLGMAGTLMQIPTVREALENQELRAFCEDLQHEFVESKMATSSHGHSTRAFSKTVIERFENPHLTDATNRLVANTHTKIHSRLLNSEAIEHNHDTKASALAIAVWIRYLQERDESGNIYSLDGADVGAAERLGLDDLKSPDLQKNLSLFLTGKPLSEVSSGWHHFTEQVVDAVKAINKKGLREALRERYPSRPIALPTPDRAKQIAL